MSCGPFASLNLSFAVGDERDAVERNWALVRESFPRIRQWIHMRQVHGVAVCLVDTHSIEPATPCDGLVTSIPGVALCVLTADCVPALVAASGGKVVAAVHAGWRGTVGRVLAEAVRVMVTRCQVSPAEIWVALGPSIGPCCYEVGEDVVRAMERAGLGAAVRCAEDGRRFVDLRCANRLILQEAGVPSAHIVDVGACTSCFANDFYSHRRQKGMAGRQLSFIVCSQEALQLGPGSGYSQAENRRL
ncbi:MAG: peptidoglycan editing factor PgeF [Candidatus Binatia bacterium]|nr:peptidoglycan editing factor PgeF [Candidatus Binatia bacterium]